MFVLLVMTIKEDVYQSTVYSTKNIGLNLVRQIIIILIIKTFINEIAY